MSRSALKLLAYQEASTSKTLPLLPCTQTPLTHIPTSLGMLSRDTEELIAYQEGRYGSYEYGRYGNPTTRTLEEKIRVLEGAEDCLVSASGMNSATTMLLALVPAGGHIVTTTDCYRRTRQFIQTVGVSDIVNLDALVLHVGGGG